jgi:enamine deaminase RidA (YjgF/YER057c/UK114 family)
MPTINGSRRNISSDGKYEKEIGYSRAVRMGNLVFVSGTTGLSEDQNMDPAFESYEQAKRAILRIADALNKADSSLDHVVLTRVYLSRNADWRQVASAHFEYFGKVLPTNSMLVCEFLDPRILVEIEAQAVIPQ